MAQSQTIAPAKAPVQAFSVLAMGVLAVSLGSIFIRLAQAESVPSLFIAAARLGIASLILTPFVLRRHMSHIRQLSRGDLILAGVSGLFLAIHFASWVSSLEYTSVLVSVVLVNTNPLWAGLLEVLFLKITISRNVKLGLAIAFGGGLLIAVPTSGEITLGQNPVLGALLAIVGAITVSVYFVIGRRLRAQLPLLPYIWLVYSCASVISLLVVLFSGISVIGYNGESYLWLVMMALIPQLVGHSSLNYALGFLPATIVTLGIQLEPMLSGLFALFLFAERPGILQIIGSVIILFGIMLASLRRSKAD